MIKPHLPPVTETVIAGWMEGRWMGRRHMSVEFWVRDEDWHDFIRRLMIAVTEEFGRGRT